MAARDAVAFETQPHKHVAAEAFDKPQAFAGLAGGDDVSRDRPVRQVPHNLFDELEALLDLADAHPHPGVDVAGIEHRHLEFELIIWLIPRRLACIEGAAAGAPDIAAGAELSRQLGT